MNIPQTKEEFLLDTIRYYGEDTSRRAKRGASCKYRTSTGEKCAIGRFIDDKSYNKNMEGKMVGQIKGKLPSPLCHWENRFLNVVQQLHDVSHYWQESKGLSGDGEDLVKSIIAEHNLSITHDQLQEIYNSFK